MTSPHPKRLLGHRGACAERPENTMVSFERAVAIGVDVIETDVHVTRDGQVVISHDPDGLRGAGIAESIAECTLEQVRAWDVGWGFRAPDGTRPFADRGHRMPTLEEALDAFPDVRFNIDLKPNDPRVVATVLSVVRRLGAADRVCLASFHGALVRAVRKADFAGETVLAEDEVIAVLLTPSLWRRKLPFGGDALQLPPSSGIIDLSSERFIGKCHRMGYRVDYWTINDPEQAARLFERGADGVISDDPAAIKPVIDRYR